MLDIFSFTCSQVKYWLTLACFGLLIWTPISAQVSDESAPARSGSFLVSGVMSSHGLGIDLAYAMGGPRRQLRIGLELRQLKDNHEARIDPVRPDRGRRYVYGKLNALTLVNPNIGLDWAAIPLSHHNPIEVRIGVWAGPAIGLLNPYYLAVCRSSTSGQSCDVTAEAYDPDIHNFFNIRGRATFSQAPFNPPLQVGGTVGGYALLDLAALDGYVNGIRVGFHLDGFANEIPLIVETSQVSNQQFFASASVAFVLGSRW